MDMIGDIENIFLQVMVAQNDRDCMRFYWWPAGNLESQLEIYSMVVHIFKAVSSSSCAIYALQQTVKDNKQLFGNHIIQLAVSRFYVDDWLNSVVTHEETVQLVREIYTLQMGFKQYNSAQPNSRI